MSRCFPFPPPGYEKKARPEDANFLKEEKHREKRHKKDKKDKDKKEDKGKKEKARSEGKHKENKDKKEKHQGKREKHKDKRKEEDRDRVKNNEKSNTAEDKRVSGQLESNIVEKFHQKEDQNKDKNSSSDEKRPAVQFQGPDGERPIQNTLLGEAEASKFVQELGRRIRDEEKGAGSWLVERSTGTDQKKDETMGRFTVRNSGMLREGLEKNEDERVRNSKVDEPRIRNEARFNGKAAVQNLAGIHNKVKGMSKPVENNIEKKMEGKEKSKEGGDDKRGDRHNDKDMEKKSHGKDKDNQKEKKKEEKAKAKSEHKKTEQDKFNDVKKNSLIGARSNKSSLPPTGCDEDASAEGSLKKRKDVETNGFLHDSEVRPNKIPRTSSHQLAENGRKLESQAPSLPTSDRQGATNNIKVDKERRVNGLIEAQPLSVSTTNPLPTIGHADGIAEASTKPSHPDSKYLNQIFSVPKMEEWSDFDDQEWLFSSSNPPSKKCEVGSSGVSEELQVWAEALQIESADVYALPYVIPY